MIESRSSWSARLFVFISLSGLTPISAFAESPASSPAQEAPRPRVFLLDPPALIKTRRDALAGNAALRPALAKLRREADEALKLTPPSVMDKQATPPSGDKHDYMSLGTYWWPNPKTANGLPYVRHDGEVNPEGNALDGRQLHQMCGAVETLALASFFLDDEKAGAKAAELLRVWFLNPATRMKPHLKFSQAIPGVCEGRALGIIDTAALARLVDSVGLLGESLSWRPEDQAGLEAWFDAYLQWLLKSDFGKDEARQPNNHGTFYDVQVAAFALFVHKKELARETLGRSAEHRIAAQIEPDGRQPLELARTKAWGYSVANLTALVELATLSPHWGIDLWHEETPDGRSIRKAIDWLARFADGAKPFEYKQIKETSYDGFGRILRQAAIAYHDPRYEALIHKLPGTDLSADRMQLIYPASGQ